MKPRGQHPHHRLTPVSVRAKRQPGRYADGNGLYLVVDPSGAKRWIWRGLVQGKRCDLGLGSVHVVPLADAREAARACRYEARKGDNPKADRAHAKRLVLTFKAAATQVHAEHSAGRSRTPNTPVVARVARERCLPVVGRAPHQHDHRRRRAPGPRTDLDGETGNCAPGEAAHEARPRLGEGTGYRDGDNPTEGIEKVLPKHKKEDKQHLAALPYQAVPAFVTTLQTIPNMEDAVRLGLEFLILTATRTNEVQFATWKEVDFKDKTWTIPGERMKSGRAHRVPLSDRAVDDPRADARPGADSIVFPGHQTGSAAVKYDLPEGSPAPHDRGCDHPRLSEFLSGLVRRTDERRRGGR